GLARFEASVQQREGILQSASKQKRHCKDNTYDSPPKDKLTLKRQTTKRFKEPHFTHTFLEKTHRVQALILGRKTLILPLP
ncbi:MAG: hypothetical protein AAF197_08555, partial [Pseudomonadota bacterium]